MNLIWFWFETPWLQKNSGKVIHYEVVEDGTENNYEASVIWQKDGSHKKWRQAKFFENPTFLTLTRPWYAHVRVRIRGWEMFVFQKICYALFSRYLCIKIRTFASLPMIFNRLYCFSKKMSRKDIVLNNTWIKTSSSN